MKNLLTIAGCCLMSAAAFASTTLPSKPSGKEQAATAAANNPKASHDAVLICHKGQEITVDSHAVPAHLAHGDQVGSCNPTPPGDFEPK
ncbi:hypothetical protein GCM10022409_14410 [Hymenobacter glaciei]|uniref:Uncharacterized protein n=1 Tax=Hymenobacter glaciei TaxID=877209 RepID=A0ABP7TU28_9BACT